MFDGVNFIRGFGMLRVRFTHRFCPDSVPHHQPGGHDALHSTHFPHGFRGLRHGPALATSLRHAAADPEIVWHDVTTWGVEGRGWETLERKRYFDRFPAKAEGVVRGPVWDLSRHSAGMAVRFRTNARDHSCRLRTAVRVRWPCRTCRPPA